MIHRTVEPQGPCLDEKSAAAKSYSTCRLSRPFFAHESQTNHFTIFPLQGWYTFQFPDLVHFWVAINNGASSDPKVVLDYT